MSASGRLTGLVMLTLSFVESDPNRSVQSARKPLPLLPRGASRIIEAIIDGRDASHGLTIIRLVATLPHSWTGTGCSGGCVRSK
jgi:hypothetical protein